MKSKTPKPGSDSKQKVKIKNLKLSKETIERLSDQDAGAIKGGATGVCAKSATGGASATNYCG